MKSNLTKSTKQTLASIKELDKDIKKGTKVVVGASMRCNIINTPVPLLDTVTFDFDGNKPVVLGLVGYNSVLNEPDPVADTIALLSTADVGLAIDKSNESGMTVFSYTASNKWTMREITILDTTYYLYNNKLTFGLANNEISLSLVVKAVTSDSKTFYEDLVGNVLVDIADIKALSWLLSEGTTITGRRLASIKAYNKLEQVNQISIYSRRLDINSSNSLSPKRMYVVDDKFMLTLDLNEVKQVVIRKQDTTIELVYTTKADTVLLLAFD
jgi:hypothetical protein